MKSILYFAVTMCIMCLTACSNQNSCKCEADVDSVEVAADSVDSIDSVSVDTLVSE